MAGDEATAPPREDFNQLKLLLTDPIQESYELIRPCVVHAETATARSAETGIDRTTISDKARRFIQDGMFGLVDQRPGNAGRRTHQFPDQVARHLLFVKQLYPPIADRELVRIVQRRYGYHTNHHTVRRFLDEHTLPVQLPLKWTLFHEFESAYQARWQVVRLFYDGWQQQSIAGCLQLSRDHVAEILAAFAVDGFAGLEDQRTRPATHPANQLSLPFMKEVLDLQKEYPRAGSFRLRGLLAQRHPDKKPPSRATLNRAMKRNRDFHGAPPTWQSNKPKTVVEEPKDLLYIPTARHQYWFVDIRYLVQLDGQWVYSICIIEGYSRKILAGAATERQDAITVLQLLRAAVEAYGCPGGLVSDNGGVFTGQECAGVLAALEVGRCLIEKGKPWQNLIEAQFKIQLRLADAKFERASTFAEVQDRHAEFVRTFNETEHWAHREREEGDRTPVAVLAWIRGRRVETASLEWIFKSTQLQRVVNRYGFIRIQRFCLYVERGLAQQRVAVWIYEGSLRIEYAETLLAQYAGAYDQRQKRLETVQNPRVYRTLYASPQLELWDLTEEQWHKILEMPASAPRLRRAQPTVAQLILQGIA